MSTDGPQRQLHDACATLERALRGGEAARAERWLDACPALAADDDLAVELIYSEFVARESMGQGPAPAEYLSRFPLLAPRLQRLFEVDDLLKTSDVPTTDAEFDTHSSLPKLTPVPFIKRIGAFELLDRLGGGGMGVVYRALQTKPRRQVALKLLRSGVEAGALELARFQREAEAVARLQHPNIVAVYEAGSAEEQPYLAMEYVRGGDLAALLLGRPQSPAWSAKLIALLARAVHYAHESGVIHRDIKPGNILMTLASPGDDRIPKLTDFGLAMLAGEAGLTRTGQVLGTLAYLAPEQAAATPQATLPTVDVYALGAVLYECLTGRPPFAADAEATTLQLILNDDPVPPRQLNPGVPRDLETIALKCLAKKPEQRYASSGELASDLTRYLENQPILARPVGSLERGIKWINRRPAVKATIATALVSLCVIVGGVIAYTGKLQNTLKEVDAQRQRAEGQEAATRQALDSEAKRREQAFAALEQLTEQLTEGTQGDARDIRLQSQQLEETFGIYKKLAAEAGPSAEQRRAAAGALRQMGRIRMTLNRSAEALAIYDNAVALLYGLVQESQEEHEYRAFLSLTLYERGALNLDLGKHEAAYSDAQASGDVGRNLPDRGLESARVREAHSRKLLVVAARRLERFDDAEAAFREGEALWIGLCRQFPKNDYYRSGWSYGHQMLAMEHLKRKRWPEAEACYRKASEIRYADGAVPKLDVDRRNQAECYQALAKLSERRGDTAAALHDHQRALDLWDGLTAERRNDVRFAQGFTKSLSIVVKAAEHPEDYDPYYLRARRYLAAAAVDANGAVVIVLASAVCQHATAHYLKKRYPEALESYLAAATGAKELMARDPKAPYVREWLAHAYVGASRTLYASGKFEQAVENWDAALKAMDRPPPMYILERAQALAQGGFIDRAIAAAGAVDLKNDAASFLKVASIYALAAEASQDPIRGEHEEAAMQWLRKAHAGGALTPLGVQSQLRRHKDWKVLRERHDFKQLLETEE